MEKSIQNDLFTIKKYFLVNRLYINDYLANVSDYARLTHEITNGTPYAMDYNADAKTLNILID